MKKVFILCAGLLAVLGSYAQKEKEEVQFKPPVIVKDEPGAKMEGVHFRIKEVNGKAVIYATKGGKTEQISMQAWEANKKMYEDKYGKLPTPPPPPPAPPAPGAMVPPPPPPPPPPPVQ